MLQYNTPDADPATTAARVAALRAANRHLGAFAGSSGEGLASNSVRRVLGYVPTWMANAAIRGKRMQSLFSPAFADEFSGRDPYQVFLNRIDLPEGAPRDPLNQSMWLWLKAIFPNKLLNFLGDRMEMAHSIEGRTPFLDHELVELVTQMPVAMKVRGMTEKYVLREAARPFLTKTVYRRQAPFELKSRMRQLVDDTLRGRALAALPFFEPNRVIRFLESEAEHGSPEQRGEYLRTLTLLNTLSILGERYGL